MIADQREFVKICQAVGVGFLVMGVIGYFVKLSALDCPCLKRSRLTQACTVHIPVNRVLVG